MLPPLNPKDFELSVEQEFTLFRYTNEIKQIPLELLQESFLEISRLLMIKDNFIRALIREAG